MRASLTFGKILGIPIGLHTSWFLVFALITWSLAAGYFPQEYPDWATGTYWLVGIITSILFFVSVLIHELGHSVVAIRDGIPVRSITLFVFGGVAQIGREPLTAQSEFRIAIAGPLTSLLLAGGFSLLGLLATVNPVLAAPAVYLARINLILALFNLIPGFPLDGGRVLRAILWQASGDFRRAARWASTVGQGVAFIFILLGVGQIFLGNLLNGLWIAFIGWFLNGAAESGYQQVVLRDMLKGVTAQEVMSQECPAVSGEMRLDDLVNQHILGSGIRCLFVTAGGDLQGLVTLHNIKVVPREQWGDVTVQQVMTPAEALSRARPDEDVWTLFQEMDKTNVNQMPVMEDGHLVGMVSREHLLRYIRTRIELGI